MDLQGACALMERSWRDRLITVLTVLTVLSGSVAIALFLRAMDDLTRPVPVECPKSEERPR